MVNETEVKTDRNEVEKVFRELNETLVSCRNVRPGDRSAQDRAFAVVITDLEKIAAYYKHWIIDQTLVASG